MSPKPPPSTSNASSSSSSRNRILVACTTCQNRRVKCARNPGQSRCEQCKRSNLECMIRPDGRRRPISRAEVDSLKSRLQSLEALLRSTGNLPIDSSYTTSKTSSNPPIDKDITASSNNLPSANNQNIALPQSDLPSGIDQNFNNPSIDASSGIDQSWTEGSNVGAQHPLPDPSAGFQPNDRSSQDLEYRRSRLVDMTLQDYPAPPPTFPENNQFDMRHSNDRRPTVPSNLETGSVGSTHMFSPIRRLDSTSGNSMTATLADTMTEGPMKTLIDRLTSTDRSVQYDPVSGTLRLTGPTVTLHQFSEADRPLTTTASNEQHRRVERILRELSPATHDHLIESFWSYYDPVMQVVDREVFDEDRIAGGGLTYSGFLHICILAMGYRYADTTRPDIRKLSLANKESTLHREAKYLVEFEFEKPGGIPSVQALLILGQLESGSGRDSIGWTYAGQAFRTAIDIGLNLDCSTLDLTKKEREFRSYVLRACTAFDRLWAIYLGRSTTMKTSDISRHPFHDRTQQLLRHQTQSDASQEKTIERVCFDSLLDLLDLTAKIVELLYSRPGPLQHSDHLVIAGLDDDLKRWYSSLSAPLVWTQSNIDVAPLPYFHLHSQYHASLVLLHRPFALYEHSKLDRNADGDSLMIGLSSVSRAICIEHIFKMVQILTQQFQRFDPTRFPQPQLQHIGTAVAALISATAVSTDPEERMKLLESLHVLADLARAISPTYAPAEMISGALDNLLKEPGWGWKQNEIKDYSQNLAKENIDMFNNTSSPAIRQQDGKASLSNVSGEYNYPFDVENDAMDMMPTFGEPQFRPQTSGALAPVSTGLSPIPSQQIDAHKELAQMSYAPLAMWTYAALDNNHGLGDSYDSGQFNSPTDMHFDSML